MALMPVSDLSSYPGDADAEVFSYCFYQAWTSTTAETMHLAHGSLW